MKTGINILLFSLILFRLNLGQAYAASKPPLEVTDEAVPTITYNDIPKLTATALDVVFATPVPMPTPISDQNEAKIREDTRSWTSSIYKNTIAEVAKRYSLDPQVIYATIMTESEGNMYAFRYEPYIQDASLCAGQILISTAQRLGFKGNPMDMYKPEVCLDLVGKYHRQMLDTFGDLTPVQLAIAYNTGSPWKRAVPGHVNRFRYWYTN